MKKRLDIIFNQRQKKYTALIIFMLLIISTIIEHNPAYIMFATSVGICIIYFNIRNYISFQRVIKNINNSELEIIEKEMKKPIWIWKNHYTLTNSYIVSQGIKVSLIKYTDIILVYKKIVLGSDSLDKKLVIVTKDKKKHKFTISSNKISIYLHYPNFEKLIKIKNPNVLIGYNNKNIKAIKKMYGFNIIK